METQEHRGAGVERKSVEEEERNSHGISRWLNHTTQIHTNKYYELYQFPDNSLLI